jgi:hypothetical protein
MMQPDNGEAANSGGLAGRKVMDWLNGKTSLAGIQIPNNLVVILGAAVILIVLIYYGPLRNSKRATDVKRSQHRPRARNGRIVARQVFL